MDHELIKEAAKLQNQLVEWRRALHQIPETGTDLPQYRSSHLCKGGNGMAGEVCYD